MEVTKKISILIVDDHNLIREVWSYILNKYKGFEVVGDCGTAEEAIEKAGVFAPGHSAVGHYATRDDWNRCYSRDY